MGGVQYFDLALNLLPGSWFYFESQSGLVRARKEAWTVKMKKKYIVLIVVSMLACAAAVLQTRSATAQPGPSDANTKQELLALINAFARLSANLAAERYSLHASGTQTCILTAHTGNQIRKFTDGEFLIVSLPIERPDDRGAVCLYADHFNRGHLNAAEKDLAAGKYREMARLYRVLLHFSPCGNLRKELLQGRLPLLEQMEKGRDVEENLRKFRALGINDDGLHAPVDYTRIERDPPTVVSNVLALHWPP